MDLQGIPKARWRASIIECYRSVSNRDFIPHDEVFFTLGAGARKKGSEYNYLTYSRFLLPGQYVSVEREIGIHRSNCIIKGPTWLYGKFDEQLAKWGSEHQNTPIALCNCDLMCGIDKALPTIRNVLAILSDRIRPKCGKTVVAFNICKEYRRNTYAYGGEHVLSPVLETLAKDSVYKKLIRQGMTLVDKWEYDNKTVGTGAGNTRMMTLVYAQH